MAMERNSKQSMYKTKLKLIINFYRNVISLHDGWYLLCESDTKAGMFIISYVRSSSVTYILVPKNNGKYVRQSLDKAVERAPDIVSSADCFKHQVPPPSHSQDNSYSAFKFHRQTLKHLLGEWGVKEEGFWEIQRVGRGQENHRWPHTWWVTELTST